MKRHGLAARAAAFGFAAALVLKAAVPALASLAASAAGVPVAEICLVYGVDLGRTAASMTQMHVGMAAMQEPAPSHVMADAVTPHEGHAGHSGSGHGAAPDHEHCALVTLAAFATGASTPQWAPASSSAAVEVVESTLLAGIGPDASARWASRLAHAPPLSA